MSALAAAAALALAGTLAQAADDGSDPVLQLLQERGLVAPPAPGSAAAVVRQVRDKASELVLAAMNFLDVPYRWGGDSAREGFDCSGFTRHIFALTLGLALPRRADEQARQAGLQPVARDELQPGDLVFFNTLRRAFSHVGIYIGEGKFIHAPRAGSEVRVEDMRSSYWARRFDGARRADLVAQAPAAPLETAAAPR
jgi:cell wall-associated NlpC family hydrolase